MTVLIIIALFTIGSLVYVIARLIQGAIDDLKDYTHQ